MGFRTLRVINDDVIVDVGYKSEGIISAGELVRDALQRAPRLSVLATSRVPLGVEGEHLWPVEPLAIDQATTGTGDGDDAENGEFAWLAKVSEDELTPRAAELVQLTGKASTSMMQTKLKVGFNRASRIIEELERVGIVGPQDPRNPAVPRAVYGPENWLKGPDDADAI